jgi:hypothetical protein
LSNKEDVEGPYIVWENNGYEGWNPKSYKDLATALTSPRYCTEWEITKRVTFKVSEDG